MVAKPMCCQKFCRILNVKKTESVPKMLQFGHAFTLFLLLIFISKCTLHMFPFDLFCLYNIFILASTSSMISILHSLTGFTLAFFLFFLNSYSCGFTLYPTFGTVQWNLQFFSNIVVLYLPYQEIFYCIDFR